MKAGSKENIRASRLSEQEKPLKVKSKFGRSVLLFCQKKEKTVGGFFFPFGRRSDQKRGGESEDMRRRRKDVIMVQWSHRIVLLFLGKGLLRLVPDAHRRRKL